MKINLYPAFLFCCIFLCLPGYTHAGNFTDPVIRVDSLIESSFKKRNDSTVNAPLHPQKKANDSIVRKNGSSGKVFSEPVYVPLDIEKILAEVDKNSFHLDTVVNEKFLNSNPFFSELIFSGYVSSYHLPAYRSMVQFMEQRNDSVWMDEICPPVSIGAVENRIADLRNGTLRRIATYDPQKIKFCKDNLPDVSDLMAFKIEAKPIEKTAMLFDRSIEEVHRKIGVGKVARNPWTMKSNAMLQFTQNYISPNWYKGGNSNISLLGIVNGQFNYDNKKNIQWDNSFEWRLGGNSTAGDTLDVFSVSDDVLKATSKLGLKAGGNWYYSGSVDFSTQFFDSRKAINSNVFKTAFLTPFRFNVNVGLDYKYKKLFSLMFSPLSYKYIYANDTVKVKQTSFGILAGKKVLSQVGSSFKAEFSYSPSREIQIDSKLSFYTNYEKIEVDWEIVGNFAVNRFLSTRLSLNPRYDNTVIYGPDEKASIQFKQLLTFGLSYRLL